MEQQIIACAAEQRAALAKDMPHRTLTIAEDETWQDGMRLVALDLSSGFILVEEVAEERSAAAWTRALTRGLDGLNVTVVQGPAMRPKGCWPMSSATWVRITPLTCFICSRRWAKP